MSTIPQQQTTKHPRVLRFLNDYRKQLALLKTKSFYANHLCKVHCLEGKLDQNRTECMLECDNWLDRFYKLKQDRNPDREGSILLSSDSVPVEERMEYEKTCARAKMEIKDYVNMLDNMLNQKIQQCTPKKK